MVRTVRSSSATTGGGKGLGREGAGRVARVHAGLLHVLHDPADDHLTGGVAHRVDVHLDGVLEEAVDQHRALRGHPALPPSEPPTPDMASTASTSRSSS